MARPPKADTVQFRRKLDNPQLQILLSAGQGNISQGFENLLALYHHLHSIGYRTEDSLDTIGFVTNLDQSKTDSPKPDQSVSKVREYIRE